MAMVFCFIRFVVLLALFHIHCAVVTDDNVLGAASPECLSSAASTFKGFGKRELPRLDTDNLSEWLWQKSFDSRMQSFNSTFVNGIRDGSLDPTSFGQYMLQDAIFCYGLSESFKLASGKLKQNSSLKAFLDHKTKSYSGYGDGILRNWLIKNASSVIVGKECQNYIDSHLNVSRNEDPIYTVIASIPCERLWPWLGQSLALVQHNYGPYASWASSDFDPTSTGYQKSEALINDAYGNGQIDKNKALRIYYNSMEGEALFFNSISA